MHPRKTAFTFLFGTTLVGCALACGGAKAADWTRFRGPNGSGVAAEEKPAPINFSPSENLRWKVDLPGPGVSCPIVAGDRVFVTSYSGYGVDRRQPGNESDLKRHLTCVDRKTGKVVWTKTVDAVLPEDPYAGAGVPTHGYASHTPASDGENVYAFFGKTGALAFDMDGNQLWQTSLGQESDPRRWGSASSPILHKGLVIVTASAESEALVALDKRTGSEVWRQEAAGLSNNWSTPILVDVDGGRTELVIGVPYEIWGLDPDTGKLLWYCESIESDQSNSSVVARDGVVYAVGGRSGGSIAVRAGGQGDVTQTHVVWSGRESNRFATPLVQDGRLYVIANGSATCLDATTGERLFQSRLRSGGAPEQADEPQGGGFGGRGRGGRGGRGGDYSSPVSAAGKIYYVRSSGEVVVLQVGADFQQLAANRLGDGDEAFMATPAVSDGQLFIRSNKALYCVAAPDE